MKHLKVNSEFPRQHHRGPNIRLSDRPDFTGNLPAECEVGKNYFASTKGRHSPTGTKHYLI